MIHSLYDYYSVALLQLNDVIKVSVGMHRAFIALPIQIDITKNSINTNTGIGIDASLLDRHVTGFWKTN